MIEPVLNELSLVPSPVPIHERIQSLIGVLRKLDALGFPRIVRQTRDALEREIIEGIPLRKWILQKAPREIRQFLGLRLQRAPFVEDLHQQQEDTTKTLIHAMCDEQPAHGACIAYLLDAPAVSLRGVSRWEIDPLLLTLQKLDEETASWIEIPVEVVHVWTPQQVERREALLRERLFRTVANGSELWNRRNELFPRLEFCGVVERQLVELSGNEYFFQHVVTALGRLDTALRSWTSGPLHPGMAGSAESRQTLDHSDYGPMRRFACPDGEERTFTNHLKLYSCNWRIHYFEFRAPSSDGRAFVGYVGVHLPTVQYRT